MTLHFCFTFVYSKKYCKKVFIYYSDRRQSAWQTKNRQATKMEKEKKGKKIKKTHTLPTKLIKQQPDNYATKCNRPISSQQYTEETAKLLHRVLQKVLRYFFGLLLESVPVWHHFTKCLNTAIYKQKYFSSWCGTWVCLLYVDRLWEGHPSFKKFQSFTFRRSGTGPINDVYANMA